MKNKWVFVLLFNMFIYASSSWSDNGPMGNLHITMHGFKHHQGEVMVSLDRGQESFASKGKSSQPSFRAGSATIKDGKAELVFKDIPFGEYAVKVFHDENSNRKIDLNKIGIPKEPYGFSNNVRGMFGPPKFEKAKFRLSEEKKEINIKLK